MPPYQLTTTRTGRSTKRQPNRFVCFFLLFALSYSHVLSHPYAHPVWTLFEKAFFIDILVDIAKQTSRWIRVLGGEYDR